MNSTPFQNTSVHTPNPVGRITLLKLNEILDQLNALFRDKHAILSIPHGDMTKAQREIFWEHKEARTNETKGKLFLCEGDLRVHKWSKSKFVFNAVGRNVVTILRHLGRIKEVRGGGQTRIVLQ